MTDAGFFRGTSSEQDNRFSDKEKKLLKQMKFADSLQKKVDMSKVNLEVLKPWISGRISELLGMEDDVLNEFVFNQLEAENNPDGRRIQINLTGFLNGKNARIFTGELWEMLLDAMEHKGVPTAILNAKKSEISERLKQEQDEQQKHQKAYESTLRSHESDRKSYHNQHQQDNRDNDRMRHSHHQSSKQEDSWKSRRRFGDESDRDRDRDRDSQRSHPQKKSRFSDSHNETEPLKSSRDDAPREFSRHSEPIFEEKTARKLDKYDDDDAPRVEMKKHKKSKHRHHRKRRSSSSDQSSPDDDEDDRRDKYKKSHGTDKKKKKKSKRKLSRSRDRSEERNLEQELRDRALESMRRQKEMSK